MRNPKIRTFNKNLKINQPHFFILNRGLNSGKPSKTPWVNSFVCLCNDEAEMDFHYWLLFGLWKAKYFHQYLVGSVIPLIRLGDLYSVIKHQGEAIKLNQSEYMKTISKIKFIEEKEAEMKKNLLPLNNLKRALIHCYIKK